MTDSLDNGDPRDLTRDNRILLLEERHKETRKQLAQGAATFGRMRAAVWAALVASLGSVVGLVYTAGRKDARMEQMAEQVAELRQHAKDSDAETRSLRLWAESVTAQLREAKDRIEAQDQLFRAMAGRRGR